MLEPTADANSTDQQKMLADGPWHDKVLTDAIGYTKSLVALLDSLAEGFQRRGRELDEQKNRLAILQSERRAILESRSALEGQLDALTADRDALRSTVEERTRELDRLRQEIAPGLAALEAHAREIESLRVAVADRTRQAEELREVVRSLERQLEHARPAVHEPSPGSARDAAIRRPAEAARSEPGVVPGSAPDSLRASDEQVARLLAERDGLRSTLEALRESVRGLELERENAGRRQSVLESELEEERRRNRDAVTRARQEQSALRADLEDAEALLQTARRDMAGDQGLIAGLRRTIEEERAQRELLQRQAQSQTREDSRRAAALQAIQGVLQDLWVRLGEEGDATGGAGPEGGEPAALSLLLELLRDLAGAADGPAEPSAGLQADRAAVRRRVEEIASAWQRVRQRQMDSTRREQQLSEENARLSAQLAAMASDQEERPAGARSAAPRERRSQKSGGLTERAPADAAPSAPHPDTGAAPRPSPTPAVSRPPAPARQVSLSGAAVECVLESSPGEPARTLRGVICRINSLGLMAAFEDQCAEGRRASIRFEGGGESFSLTGRILRVQQPASTPGAHPVFHHLIRFEASPAGSVERLQALVG